MDVAVLVRGQTNAAIFQQSHAAEEMRAELERMLGFDGVKDRVLLLGEAGQGVAAGVPFVGTTTQEGWVNPAPGGGWTDGKREKALLEYLAHLTPAQRLTPVITVWMGNEADMLNPSLTGDTWSSALIHDYNQVNAALHTQEAKIPYMFVWIPSRVPAANTPSVAATAQAMKQAYPALSTQDGFDIRLGPQTGDLEMDGPGGTISRLDGRILAHRAASCIADIWSRDYAKTFSDADRGELPCLGPIASKLWVSAATPADLHVKLQQTMPGNLHPLSNPAALGAGWRAISAAHPQGVTPKWVRIDPNDTLTVHFAEPVDDNATIYYGYGAGRIAEGDDPALGSAIYDSGNFPVTMAPSGVVPARIK